MTKSGVFGRFWTDFEENCHILFKILYNLTARAKVKALKIPLDHRCLKIVEKQHFFHRFPLAWALPTAEKNVVYYEKCYEVIFECSISHCYRHFETHSDLVGARFPPYLLKGCIIDKNVLFEYYFIAPVFEKNAKFEEILSEKCSHF